MDSLTYWTLLFCLGVLFSAWNEIRWYRWEANVWERQADKLAALADDIIGEQDQ